MGGRLWVTSEVGRGSSFFVDLPLAGSPQPAGPAGTTVPAAVAARPKGAPDGDPRATPDGTRTAAPCPSLRVLVAEDNAINQKVISAMLSRQGWTVTLAVNGREAVRRFQDDSFDLILMDIQMPEMDGMEAARLIRQQEQTRGGSAAPVPIIALTANAAFLQREEYLAGGMDEVLTKPINLRNLLEAIGAVLGCAPGSRS